MDATIGQSFGLKNRQLGANRSVFSTQRHNHKMKRATLWLLTNPEYIAAAVYGMVTAILIRVM